MLARRRRQGPVLQGGGLPNAGRGERRAPRNDRDDAVVRGAAVPEAAAGLQADAVAGAAHGVRHRAVQLDERRPPADADAREPGDSSGQLGAVRRALPLPHSELQRAAAVRHLCIGRACQPGRRSEQRERGRLRELVRSGAVVGLSALRRRRPDNRRAPCHRQEPERHYFRRAAAADWRQEAVSVRFGYLARPREVRRGAGRGHGGRPGAQLGRQAVHHRPRKHRRRRILRVGLDAQRGAIVEPR